MDLGTIFVWLVAVFYAVAGVAPLGKFSDTSKQYVAWGYPTWFPFVTAVLEVAVGVLLVLPAMLMAGVGLGVLIMLAAIATLIRSKEYSHAIAPVVVLVVTVLAGYFGG